MYTMLSSGISNLCEIYDLFIYVINFASQNEGINFGN